MTQAPTPGPLSGDAMRAEYSRVEQIREQAETHERSARSTNDLQAKSDHETQASMAWDRYDRALAKFNAAATGASQ